MLNLPLPEHAWFYDIDGAANTARRPPLPGRRRSGRHRHRGAAPRVATLHLAEMVDPNYLIVAGIDKRYLPPKP